MILRLRGLAQRRLRPAFNGMKKVLVVEDDQAMGNVLSAKIKNEGFETAQAQNGEDALLLLKQSAFDLMVLDLIMPKLDGVALLEKMSQEGIELPVIIVSNLSQYSDRSRVAKYNVVEFFSKSDTTVSEIVKFVKNFLA